MQTRKSKIEACVRHNDLWMLHNKLKLNKDKTELLILSSSFRPKPNIDSLEVAGEMVNCSPKARNIGVLFDTSLSMIPHVDSICKTTFFHLYNYIAKIWRFLTPDTTKTIVHAFVTWKVDYCNSLLYGLPRFLLQKLQRVLNCAARLVCHSRKFDHVTPIMIELHWLPIGQRVHFEIVLITFRLLIKLLQCTFPFLTFYRIIVPRECSDPLIKICFKRRNINLNDMAENHSRLRLHFYGMPYPII